MVPARTQSVAPGALDRVLAAPLLEQGVVVKRYTLAQATRIIVGDDSGLGDPERWVVRQLRSGRFPGLKIGRNWFMTDADIEAAQATLRNDPKPRPEPEPQPVGILGGLSERAARRLIKSAS
jgi:hypothetical protein